MPPGWNKVGNTGAISHQVAAPDTPVDGQLWADPNGVAPGVVAEVGYTALVTSVAAANAPDTLAHDVNGMQITFTGATRPVKITATLLFQLALGTLASGSVARINAYLQQINGDASLTQRDSDATVNTITTGNTYFEKLRLEYRFVPVVGTVYSFKVQQATPRTGLSIAILGQDLGVETYIEVVQR